MTVRSLTVARPVLDTALPFALPIGLSAFLLFSVEPLVGRLTLPVFGGTPAVWATTLFFFQAVLLAGYLYSHLSVTRFGRWGPPIHLVIAGLGLVALLTAPSRVADLRSEAVTPVADLVLHPAARHRPAGVRPHDHDPVGVGLAPPVPAGRRPECRRRRRPVLAVRPQQRRVAPRPPGLPAPHRATPRAVRAARRLGRGVRGAHRTAGADGHPGPPGRCGLGRGCSRRRLRSRLWTSARRRPPPSRSTGPGASDGCCSRRSRPVSSRPSRPSSRPTSSRRRCSGSSRSRSISHRSSSRSRRAAVVPSGLRSSPPRPWSRSSGSPTGRPAAGPSR